MIKLGRTETLLHTFYADEIAADAGTVTVTVKNQAGTTIYTGSATKNVLVYSFALPAQTDLGKLTIQWTGTILSDTSYTEVIGDYLFELADIRALLLTRGLKKNYDNNFFLRDVRDQVTEIFESITNWSFVNRRKTVRVPVTAGKAFLPTVGVYDVLTVDDAAFTGDFLPYGYVSGLEGISATITYEYGRDAGVTAEARGMALDLAVWLIGAQTRTTPDNAESVSDANGNTYRLAVVGTRGIEVAVPHVDAFLKRIKFEMPGVA